MNRIKYVRPLASTVPNLTSPIMTSGPPIKGWVERGRFVQWTSRPRNASYKGRVVPGTERPRTLFKALLGKELKGQCHEIFCFWFFS
jgi:hypothetical protein